MSTYRQRIARVANSGDEEPGARDVQARICGGLGWATTQVYPAREASSYWWTITVAALPASKTVPDPIGHLTPLDIRQEGPDLCRPGPSLRRSPVTIRSSDRIQVPLLVQAAVELPLDDPGPVTGREPRVAELLVAGRVDQLAVDAVHQREEDPPLVGPAVELVLDDRGPVAGRAPRVVEHLAAGRVDDQVSAVGQRDERPLLVRAAGVLPLDHLGPVTGREPRVAELLVAGRVGDVIRLGGSVTRRQQLPLLVQATVVTPLDHLGPVTGRGTRIAEHHAAIRVDYLNVAVPHPLGHPLLVQAAVPLPLDDPGPVTGREPRVAEHLAAGLVDQLAVDAAVRHRQEVPPLVHAAVELPLLDDGPVAGRAPRVVEHLAAGRVDDVIPREQLPALQGLAIRSMVARRARVIGPVPRHLARKSRPNLCMNRNMVMSSSDAWVGDT